MPTDARSAPRPCRHTPGRPGAGPGANLKGGIVGAVVELRRGGIGTQEDQPQGSGSGSGRWGQGRWQPPGFERLKILAPGIRAEAVSPYR